MNAEELLFASGDLQMTLEAQRRRARQAVDEWDPEQLLPTAEADIIEYLVAEYSVACPVLHKGAPKGASLTRWRKRPP